MLNRSTLAATLLLLLNAMPVPASAAEQFLVKDGQPQAEIIISTEPARSTRLAAHELQTYLEKISGAKLPIRFEPAGNVPVQVYIGRSTHTDRLQVTPDKLKYGAYRMVSGDGWFVLTGDDTDFVPVEPWAKNNNDRVTGKLQREWDEITGAKWGVPNGGMYKNRMRMPADIGLPEGATAPKEPMEVWSFDERGSFNAVCGFLRSLGVRWYLPGELGEVVPRQATIALPAIDETVQPDFPVRQFNIRFGVYGLETAMWAMRLGMRDDNGIQTAHGLDTMTHRDEIFEAHPEWFALYGGRRQTQPGQRLNQLCYSSEGLFEATVKYVRAQFDHYDTDIVSVMPPDGYTAICQCPLCEGKDTPERPDRGRLSDYVWDFVNRVAREVRKTHPDKKVGCCAYGVYTLPPEKIQQLEPNVVVIIVGGRRPTYANQEELAQLRAGWVAKTANPIMIFENYPFTGRGWYLPSYQPHVLGESINATKGVSMGEDIWLTIRQDFDRVAIGFNHFLVYFTARMYWGGKEQSAEDLFSEYCRLFYGPAGAEMKAFFEFCEANWREMEKDKALVDTTFELLAAAEKKTEPEAVFGRRIALVADYLKALKNKGEQLAKQRGPVPQLRLQRNAADIVIDGKLDDEFWEKSLTHAHGSLRELQTGQAALYGTTFKAAWGEDGNLYFAIRCEERAGGKLNIGTTRREDQAIWYGDVVEILLETDSHSYYQLAVNPAGALIDLDRGAARSAWFGWDSQAEVATQVADDHWTVEIRIPVVQDENDPLHQVVGRKPTSSLPWHFNVCRQRIRDNGSELSAFSPTGTSAFHETLKFGQLYEGRSHRFDQADDEVDFLSQSREAAQLRRQGKLEEALAAWTRLAEGKPAGPKQEELKLTERQKSWAVEQAAECARSLRQLDRAAELAEAAPLEAVAKTIRMENLLAQGKLPELFEQFGDEDFSTWPFWKAGEGYALRGQAHSRAGHGEQAEADFQKALERTTERQARENLWLATGINRYINLKDAEQALAAYRHIVEGAKNNFGATAFRGVQNTASILREQQKYDESLATLRIYELSELRGYWRGALYRTLADTLKAAGKQKEAEAAYGEVLKEKGSSQADRKAAEQALQDLTGRTSR